MAGKRSITWIGRLSMLVMLSGVSLVELKRE
jgi:hypothetical protein